MRIKDNEEFPCDLVVVSCDDPDGVCFITTANLDGETNLKVSDRMIEHMIYLLIEWLNECVNG